MLNIVASGNVSQYYYNRKSSKATLMSILLFFRYILLIALFATTMSLLKVAYLCLTFEFNIKNFYLKMVYLFIDFVITSFLHFVDHWFVLVYANAFAYSFLSCLRHSMLSMAYASKTNPDIFKSVDKDA